MLAALEMHAAKNSTNLCIFPRDPKNWAIIVVLEMQRTPTKEFILYTTQSGSKTPSVGR